MVSSDGRCGILLPLMVSFASLLYQSGAYADTVYLRNGRKVVGRIVAETKTEIVVERGSIRVTIQKSEIEEIEYDTKKSGKEEREDVKKWLEEGRRLCKQGRYREAVDAFRKADTLGELPTDCERMMRLSFALTTAGDMLKRLMLKEAKEALQEAFSIEPENSYAKKLSTEIERYDKILAENGSLDGDFLTLETKHFKIYHHHPYLASEVASSAKEHLEHILKAMLFEGSPKPRLKEKFKIYIHRDRKEYEESTGRLGGMFHSMTLSKTEIATYQKVVMQNIRHEITHLLLHKVLPSMPVWVHEGFATGGYERAASRVYSTARVHIQNGRFLPFDQFLKIRTPDRMPMTLDSFYLQSRMAVEFLVFGKGGMEKFHRFARRSRELMVKNVKEFAKTQKRPITVRNIDWIEEPMRQMLSEVYGYEDLKEFDSDLKAYIEHREREARYQEQQRSKKLEADWKHNLRLDSEHFVLFTTSSRAVAAPILELAEKLYEKFWLEFADTKMFIPGRVKIYLFDKLKEYSDYLKKKGHTIRQGKDLIPHFSPFTGAACVFREGNTRDYLYQTTLHEIAHALSVSLMKSFYGSGRWVVEGIAHYVGLSFYSKTKRVVFGKIHQTSKSEVIDYLRSMVRDGRITPLKEFVNLDYNGLRRRWIANNVQCWSLFHFLQHAKNGKYRDGFHRYLAEICRGKGGDADSFERLIGKFSEVEPEYRRYIKTLKATTKTK